MKQVKKASVKPDDAASQVGTISHEYKSETSLSRVAQVYRFEAGVLMGMLFDEARRRNQELAEMAHELSVTPGYVHQLANRLRSTAHISHDFATACASYLNVPAIVVVGFSFTYDIVRRCSSKRVFPCAGPSPVSRGYSGR